MEYHLSARSHVLDQCRPRILRSFFIGLRLLNDTLLDLGPELKRCILGRILHEIVTLAVHVGNKHELTFGVRLLKVLIYLIQLDRVERRNPTSLVGFSFGGVDHYYLYFIIIFGFIKCRNVPLTAAKVPYLQIYTYILSAISLKIFLYKINFGYFYNFNCE